MSKSYKEKRKPTSTLNVRINDQEKLEELKYRYNETNNVTGEIYNSSTSLCTAILLRGYDAYKNDVVTEKKVSENLIITDSEVISLKLYTQQDFDNLLEEARAKIIANNEIADNDIRELRKVITDLESSNNDYKDKFEDLELSNIEYKAKINELETNVKPNENLDSASEFVVSESRIFNETNKALFARLVRKFPKKTKTEILNSLLEATLETLSSKVFITSFEEKLKS